MATHTTAEPSVGELRFIARLKSSALPLEYPFGSVSTTVGSTSTVEGSDVFVVDGQTRSKFYSSERFIDDSRVSLIKRFHSVLKMLLTELSTAFTETAPTASTLAFS
jgi:hypothetical protein